MELKFSISSRHAALLDVRQVKQIIDHAQQPVTILPGREQKLDLLGGQGAHRLLEEQMDDHLEAGQGGLELVANRRDHVAFELIDQAKLGHVGQDDGCARAVLRNR